MFERSEHDFDDDTAVPDHPPDRGTHRLVADEGRHGGELSPALAVSQAHGLDGALRVHGRLQQCGAETAEGPAASGRALGEDRDASTLHQAGVNSLDHVGQQSQSFPFDGDDTHPACECAQQTPVEQIRSCDELRGSDRGEDEDIRPRDVRRNDEHAPCVRPPVTPVVDRRTDAYAPQQHARTAAHRALPTRRGNHPPGRQERHHHQHDRDDRDAQPHRRQTHTVRPVRQAPDPARTRRHPRVHRCRTGPSHHDPRSARSAAARRRAR